MARQLADAGREVVVVERRSHLGGNVHDHTHPSGIRIHTYGPHYFRTESEAIWEFVTRFAEFYPFEAQLKTLVDGRFENWPIAGSYVNRTVGPDWRPSFTGTPGNFEEASLAMMPRLVYEKFVSGYTAKQWGVPPTAIDAKVAGRFAVHHDDDPRLKSCRYQGLPADGYAAWITNLLQGIPVVLNADYLSHQPEFTAKRKLIFTGPIDEFFGFDLGRLVYRGQQRSHDYLPEVNYHQPCVQVNNPDPNSGPHIRVLEWKHMMLPVYASRLQGTVITRETPFTPDDPDRYEYPFPDRRNAELYSAYRARADALPDVLICGRLGEYKYYDMDQTIGRAMALVRKTLAVD